MYLQYLYEVGELKASIHSPSIFGWAARCLSAGAVLGSASQPTARKHEGEQSLVAGSDLKQTAPPETLLQPRIDVVGDLVDGCLNISLCSIFSLYLYARIPVYTDWNART